MKSLSYSEAMSYGAFGIRKMGAHTVYKLRFTKEQGNYFLQSPIARRYANDIYVHNTFSKQGKQYTWIIAVVACDSQANRDLAKQVLLTKADKLMNQAEQIYQALDIQGQYQMIQEEQNDQLYKIDMF